MSIELEIVPVPKPRMTRADRWKKRPCVVRYFEYKDKLLELASGYKPGGEISLTFIMPMPKSWSKKKKDNMNHEPHQSRPDLDNLLKGWQDCLCEEDSHIHTYKYVNKIWGRKGLIIIYE